MSEFKSRKFVTTNNNIDGLSAGKVYTTYKNFKGVECIVDDKGNDRLVKYEFLANNLAIVPEPEIKVWDLYTFVGEENGKGYYTKGKTYQVKGVFNDRHVTWFTMSADKGVGPHWWTKHGIEEQFFPGSFDSKPQIETGVTMRTSPIQTTTVHKIISGDYGRLRVQSDGYHAVNLSISDKGRCVSVEEMRAMGEVLEEIILAKEGN